MSPNEFKELILDEGYDNKKEYKVRYYQRIDDDYFNGNKDIRKLIEDDPGECDEGDEDIYFYEDKRELEFIAGLLFISYNKPQFLGNVVNYELFEIIPFILKFLNKETCLTLIEYYFVNDIYFKFIDENLVDLCSLCVELGGDFSFILNKDTLYEIINITISRNPIDDKLLDYIVNNFDIINIFFELLTNDSQIYICWINC